MFRERLDEMFGERLGEGAQEVISVRLLVTLWLICSGRGWVKFLERLGVRFDDRLGWVSRLEKG